ncbi:MAG: M3 family oligoendopeptidase [Treponema sp.]|nr:M3 family oligoendopeptidase [Treponema sp.]
MTTTTNTVDSTPIWSLDSLYPNLSSKKYKDALHTYYQDMDELDALFKSANTIGNIDAHHFDFPLWLHTYLEKINKTGALLESLYAYAYIIYSTDTTNKAYLDNISVMDELQLRFEQQDLQFKALLKQYAHTLDDFYARYPEYTDYAYILQQAISDTQHQMTKAEENLTSVLQRTGGDAWARLQEQIISNMSDCESGKTFNELRNDAYSDDPHIREQSWQTELALLKQSQIPLAAALNNLKGETIALNKRRNWNTAIDRALDSSRLSKKSLQALIAAIEDSLSLWREYLQLKAHTLRKHHATVDTSKQKGLAFYDLFAPMPFTSTSKTWTFAEARDYIISEYTSFSEDMGTFAKKAFDSNWIDAKVRAGKVGGAYCQDFPAQKESRILSNFTGTFSDIITLAHELGHAYHHNCITCKDYVLSSYPMTLAETASTFAETIVKQDAITHTTDTEKISLIELDLQDVCQVLVDILCRYYFEQSVFEERAKGELTAEDFCTLMLKAQERSYGDGLNENKHAYMWAIKSHYYSTDLDFYNFPYAFGQLFAAGLYARYKKEGPAFAQVYKQLLANTGMSSCEDVCKQAGFDITTKDFWTSGIEVYKQELEQLKLLLQNQ